MTHFFANRVTCPFCGYAYTPGDMTMMPGYVSLEDRFKEECVNCKHTFIVHRTLTEMFETSRKELLPS
jgi:hypothetical protein